MASKKTITLHNLAALGPERLAAILVDLAEVDSETPTGTRRRLGQSLEKTVWLSGAELKVRIQLPPAESLRLDDRTDSAPGTIRATTYVLGAVCAQFARVNIERLFRDAHAGAVMAPTGDVLRDFIAKAILGMPLF